MSLHLDWVNAKTARKACERWHYARKLPPMKGVYLGAWEDGIFTGIIAYTNSASIMLPKGFGLAYRQVVELARIALSSHRFQVSRLIAISSKMVRKKMPGLRLIVSFADTRQKHHGGVYQAAGWIYTGEGGAKTEYVIGGRVIHCRDYSAAKYGAAAFGRQIPRSRFEHAQIIKAPPKHRYLLPLDDGMRDLVSTMAKPYPKRARSIAVDASANHAEEGGSSPTRALHLTDEST